MNQSLLWEIRHAVAALHQVKGVAPPPKPYIRFRPFRGKILRTPLQMRNANWATLGYFLPLIGAMSSEKSDNPVRWDEHLK